MHTHEVFHVMIQSAVNYIQQWFYMTSKDISIIHSFVGDTGMNHTVLLVM